MHTVLTRKSKDTASDNVKCLPVVSTMHQMTFELVLSFECRLVPVTVNSSTNHHSIKQFSSIVSKVLGLPCRHCPASFTIQLLFHRHHSRLKLDVLLQLEMIGVHAKVLEELGVV